MTPERFRSCLDSYGADLSRWPADSHEAARAWLDAHPAERAALDDAARLDAVLHGWTVPGPGAALAARVGAIAAEPRRRLALWWSALGGAALASGLVAGAIAVAITAPAPEPTGNRLYELTVLGAPLDLGPAHPADGPS